MKTKYTLVVAGILLGAALGYVYWANVACLSGTCPLNSTPYLTLLLWAWIGGNLGSYISDRYSRKRKSCSK
ncbi:MAG: hypothetical protein NZ529_06655 [Cytophagaceae bacterium]|nr:hypothetical protein [Cytophagaceae bacterium]MDW8456460.1 hypothetical protein [Cytophagaceae bacterium]